MSEQITAVTIDKTRIKKNAFGGRTYMLFDTDGIRLGTSESKQIMNYLKEQYGEDKDHRIRLLTSVVDKKEFFG